MRNNKLLAALVFLFSVSAFAEDALFSVKSRSIMPSCEFVYSVESDIIVEPQVELNDDQVIKISFENSWEEEPIRELVGFAELNAPGQRRWTFQSMSTSKSFLYRRMFLQIGHLNQDLEFVSESDEWVSDIGRQFGEACHRSRSQNPNYVVRGVMRSELPEF